MDVNITLDSIGKNFSFVYNEGVPLRGMKNITNLIENTTGTTATRFFTKEYRFAMNGFRFTEFKAFTTVADFINDIQGSPTTNLPIKNDLRIEFRYIRSGTDNTGNLTLDELTIDGIYHTQYAQTLDFENTVFQNLGFTDDYWNKVFVNLMEKLYDNGVMPTYVQRGDDDLDDDDYIDFCKTIAMWWGLHIALADYVITKMDDDKNLLSNYLRQRNLFLFGDESINRLKFLSQNIYDEIRRRGTKAVHFIDGTYDNPKLEPKHGELTRLIGHDVKIDEYLWEFIDPSWYIGSNSPSTFNCIGHDQINKTPENTEDFVDLNKFQTNTGVTIVTDGTKKVANISAGNKLVTKPTKISSKIGYTIYFSFKGENANSLTVKLIATDRYGTSRNLLESDTNSIKNEMVTANGLSGNYYNFKGHIFENGAALLSSGDSNNLFGGKHLRFSSADTNRISIEISNPSAGYLRIHDFKMVPFENPKGGIFLNGIYQNNIWLKNNNTTETDKNLEEKIMEYLIPLDSSLNINEV